MKCYLSPVQLRNLNKDKTHRNKGCQFYDEERVDGRLDTQVQNTRYWSTVKHKPCDKGHRGLHPKINQCLGMLSLFRTMIADLPRQTEAIAIASSKLLRALLPLCNTGAYSEVIQRCRNAPVLLR